jgi:hypothetical protein
MKTHTATPWKASGSNVWSDETTRIAIASNSKQTCDDENEANAAHIVKCVNMHGELLEALRYSIGSTTDEGWKTYRKWVEKLIAKAEGV